MKTSYSRRPKPYRRVGGTKRKMAAPVAVGSTYKQGAGNKFKMVQNADGSTRVYGRSFISSVGTTASLFSATGNDIGLVFDINPNLLGDRVATIASTYEKYVYQAVKFTWVPQCGTNTAGSVVMVMDRDNLTDAANPAAAAYLQEAMGYEHAVISPPWTECCVSYSREKSEKKIFQGHLDQDSVGSKDATQGNFLVYTMGVPAVTALGFIVMDFVLDLITPSLIPERTGAGSLNYSTPGQWSMFNLALTSASQASVQVARGFPAYTFTTNTGSSAFPLSDQNGGVYELCLAGKDANLFSLPQSSLYKFYWDTEATQVVALSPGSKLYAVVLPQYNSATTTWSKVIIFTSNLNTALSVASAGMNQNTTTSGQLGMPLNNCVFTTIASGSSCGNQSFWGRRIVMTGVSTSLNQA